MSASCENEDRGKVLLCQGVSGCCKMKKDQHLLFLRVQSVRFVVFGLKRLAIFMPFAFQIN